MLLKSSSNLEAHRQVLATSQINIFITVVSVPAACLIPAAFVSPGMFVKRRLYLIYEKGHILYLFEWMPHPV